MKSFFGHLACWLIILAALSYFFYPTLSDQLEQARRIPQIEKFERQIRNMDSGRAAEIKAAWKQYNESLFSGADQLPGVETVNGLIAVLEIPDIDVRLPVYPSGDSQARDTGVLYNSRSSLPTGQAGERTVLAGNNGRLAHTNSPWIDPWLEKFQVLSAQLLHRLDQLKQGSIMYLYTPCGVQAYEVAELQQVEGGQIRMPDTGDAWLVVMTNLEGQRRQLVYGKLMSLPANTVVMEHSDSASIPADSVNVLLMGSPVLAVGLVFILLVEFVRRWHYRLPNDGRKHKMA